MYRALFWAPRVTVRFSPEGAAGSGRGPPGGVPEKDTEPREDSHLPYTPESFQVGGAAAQHHSRALVQLLAKCRMLPGRDDLTLSTSLWSLKLPSFMEVFGKKTCRRGVYICLKEGGMFHGRCTASN